MFVLTRRSALPRLQFVPGGLARWHDNRITLLPLESSPELGFTVEPLPGGGYGVILRKGLDPSYATVVAQYPTRFSARRQLRRLAGDAGWGAAGGLGRGLLLLTVLFVAWFLFFVPGNGPALQTAAREGNGAAAGRPALVDPAVSPPAGSADGPAFVDDPADPATASAAPDAAPVR